MVGRPSDLTLGDAGGNVTSTERKSEDEDYEEEQEEDQNYHFRALVHTRSINSSKCY
jgi:hypothetical protein